MWNSAHRYSFVVRTSARIRQSHPMRLFSASLIVCFFLSRGGLSAAETRDLILVAGQSNAVGFDATPAQLPADPADKDVLFWWRCGDPPPDDFDSNGPGWTALQAQPVG